MAKHFPKAKGIFVAGCVFVLSNSLTFAQSAAQIPLSTSYGGQSFESAIEKIQRDLAVSIQFKREWIEGIVCKRIATPLNLDDFFKENLSARDITVVEYGGIFFLVKQQVETVAAFSKSREKDDVVVVGDGSGLPNQIVKMNGVIRDGKDNSPLLGAQVYIKALSIGTTTNFDGRYELKIPVGRYKADISYIGYETSSYTVAVTSAGTFDVELFSGLQQMEELLVTSDGPDRNVNQKIAGVEKIGIQTMKALPTFMGEMDVVKSLATLPGISTTSEVSSGFNVRGGESGQNLILQDGTVIYNPSHLFGFFSAFNPDLVSNLVLFKGGGPANFGGRISSITNVQLRSGNLERAAVSGGVGLVSSRLTVESPLIKRKSSVIVSGRQSYTNWLLARIPSPQVTNSQADFGDITGKIFQKIGSSDQLTGTVYLSKDQFRLASDTIYAWQTRNFSAQWDHIFSTKTLAVFQFTSSNYTTQTKNDDALQAFEYYNSISNTALKTALTHNFNSKNSFTIGFDAALNEINPGKISPTNTISLVDRAIVPNQRAVEAGLYVQHEWDVTQKLALSTGLRLAGFYRLGEEMLYSFAAPGRTPVLTDSTFYGANAVSQRYNGIEPRFSMRYLLSTTTSVRFSYYRINQFLHLISNTVAANPQDYWVASSPYLKPQKGNQFSGGLFKTSSNGNFEWSSEVFYKDVANTVEFIEGADLALNKVVETSLIQGRGISYGLELQLKKNNGILNGFASYTFSRSLRKFDGEEAIYQINKGSWFPASVDKPHDLSVVANYQSGRGVFTANFSYSTGRPITVPISKFVYGSTLSVLNYSQRNEYRIPNYHRLDLSYTLKEGLRKNATVKSEWVFSVYNIYGRRNPYSVYFDGSGAAYKLSILGAAFPSISYNFRF